MLWYDEDVMTKGIFWQKILTYLTHKIAYVDDISLLFQFVSQEYSNFHNL